MSDTICALATPPGIAGLAVIRVSGPSALATCSDLLATKVNLSEQPSHTITYGTLGDKANPIDTVTLSVFRSPTSYTGEDVVEIGCHGGHAAPTLILDLLRQHGIRPAEPGEFTKRAFLNGKLDLLQVEAVADIIHAHNTKSALVAARQLRGGLTRRIASIRNELVKLVSLLELELDFAHEDLTFTDSGQLLVLIEGINRTIREVVTSAHTSELLRHGVRLAIVGYPNAGKSTLFNALLGRDRALVSDVAGTTRDYLEEYHLFHDVPIRILDTAGLRETSDQIELAGVRLTRSVIEESDIIAVVNDYSLGPTHSDTLLNSIRAEFPGRTLLLIQNKCDGGAAQQPGMESDNVYVSAKTGLGIDVLKDRVRVIAAENIDFTKDYLLNVRQAALLNEVQTHLEEAIGALSHHVGNELVVLPLKEAIAKIGLLTGRVWSDEILNSIFSGFCIGK